MPSTRTWRANDPRLASLPTPSGSTTAALRKACRAGMTADVRRVGTARARRRAAARARTGVGLVDGMVGAWACVWGGGADVGPEGRGAVCQRVTLYADG